MNNVICSLNMKSDINAKMIHCFPYTSEVVDLCITCPFHQHQCTPLEKVHVYLEIYGIWNRIGNRLNDVNMTKLNYRRQIKHKKYLCFTIHAEQNHKHNCTQDRAKPQKSGMIITYSPYCDILGNFLALACCMHSLKCWLTNFNLPVLKL